MKRVLLLGFLLGCLNGLFMQILYANPAPKTQIIGLIDRQDTSWTMQANGTPLFTLDNINQFPGLFAGVVINTSWAALQPTSAGSLDVSTIDGPLKQIATYNLNHPAYPLAVKLRIWAGYNAPLWAKSLGGPPIVIYRNPSGNCTGKAPQCPMSVGRFWDVKGGYIQAWRALQVNLAAIYDKNPLIRQVAVTSCTQQTDEPFVSSLDKTSQLNLKTAGYSDEQQQVCLTSANTVDYIPWKNTLIDFSFNPFFSIDHGGQNMGFTTNVMDNCIATFQDRCIVDTQSIGKAGQNINTPILSVIKSHAKRVSLQTASPLEMGNEPNQPPNMTIWSNTFSIANQLAGKGLEVWCEKKRAGFDIMNMDQACQLLNILLPGEIPKPPCQ